MKKRILSLVLVLTMIMSMLPLTAFSADDGGDGDMGTYAATDKEAYVAFDRDGLQKIRLASTGTQTVNLYLAGTACDAGSVSLRVYAFALKLDMDNFTWAIASRQTGVAEIQADRKELILTGGNETIINTEHPLVTLLVTPKPGIERRDYTMPVSDSVFRPLGTGEYTTAVCGEDAFVFTVEDQYTVSYHLNNGTGPLTTDSNKYFAGDTVTVVASNPTDFSRTHYKFQGWNKTQNATTGITSFIMPADDVTLYAAWLEDLKYTVTYDANDGDSASVPTDGVPSRYAEEEVAVAQGVPTRAEHDFLGWSKDKDETDPQKLLKYGDKFDMPEEHVILYAIWEAWVMNDVVYDLNGGSGDVPGTTRHRENTIVQVSTQQVNISRGGYEFRGWSTNKNATTGMTIFTMPNKTATLYAVWVSTAPVETEVYVTFDEDALNFKLTPDTTQEVDLYLAGTACDSGATLQFRVYAFAMNLNMDKFTWAVKANSTQDGTAVVQASSGKLIIASNVNPGAPATVDTSEPFVTLLVTPHADAEAGDYIMEVTDSLFYQYGSTYNYVTAREPLAFVLPVQYTLSYDLQGDFGTAPAAKKYVAETQVSVDTGENYTRARFEFGGWSTEQNQTDPAKKIENFTIQGNTTLYAIWIPHQTYTVSYDLNGAVDTGEFSDSQVYYANDEVTIVSGEPTRKWYNFKGWSLDGDSVDPTEQHRAPGSKFDMPADNVTLCAIWEEHTKYSVTYMPGNDVSGDPAGADETYYEGQTITQKTVGTMVKTGYAFKGWSTVSAAEQPEAVIVMGKGNLVLYAVWWEKIPELNKDKTKVEGTAGKAFEDLLEEGYTRVTITLKDPEDGIPKVEYNGVELYWSEERNCYDGIVKATGSIDDILDELKWDSSQAAARVLYGDVDGDGKVNSKDFTLLAVTVVQEYTEVFNPASPDMRFLLAADVEGTNKMDVNSVTALGSYIMHGTSTPILDK